MNKRHLPFDFCSMIYKIIIEIDGRQHFEQVRNWDSLEFIQARDKYKEICAKENGFIVYRILQTDIWYDRNNWKELLHKFLIPYLTIS
jgi:very-short-patch-repair endonuclease